MGGRTARNFQLSEMVSGGTITSISAQQKSRTRVNISIDDEYAFSVHLDVLLSEGLHRGQALSVEDVEIICARDDFHLARDLALNFVSYRPRSIHEVKQRLRKSNHNIQIIDQVITRLLELNMLDDDAFASEFVEGRLRNKGYGPRRLRQDLKRRGIHDSIIEVAISRAFSKIDPEALALTAGRKIFLRLGVIPDRHIRRKKLSDYLARRGFTYDHMARAIKELELHVQKLEK